MQTTIAALASRGYSIRYIARELGINRRTVRRYFPPELSPKRTTPQPEVTSGSGAEPDPQRTSSQPEVTSGSKSRCEPFREVILGLLAQGLTSERIWQDLRAGSGLTASYSSVRRFVKLLRKSSPQAVQRIECEPGEELQVDFMQGPMLPVNDLASGAAPAATAAKRKRCWILIATLSHSRKIYCEAVWRQDSESFLRGLENALRALGGVPTLLSLDNLKAAVTKADWYDPALSPKFADFCRHYGITPMPCRSYTPQHKGKVERSVQYVRGNALAGHEFTHLSELNAHLRQWVATVADTRIHGTTRRQVGEHFRTAEKSALKPLPVDLFPAYSEVRRRVNRDSYVEVASAYYQAPPEHIGRDVWVRYDGRAVRLFCLQKMDLIATHTRQEPGRYSAVRGVRGLDQAGSLVKTQRHWQYRADAMGPAVGDWAQASFEHRGAAAMRSVMGLCHLHPKHSAESIATACAAATAAHRGDGPPSLRSIRIRLVHKLPEQPHSPAMETTVQVRALSSYEQYVHEQKATFNSSRHSA